MTHSTTKGPPPKAEDKLKMVSGSRVFAIAGFITSGLALACLVASFASPFWVESTDGVSPSGFERMGLWEACFHNYYPINRPVTKKRYEGCFAAISYEMRDIYDYFYPSWMRGVQGMVTLAMLLTLVCVVINILYFIRCCRGPLERYLVLASAVMAFISALFLFIAGTMFGVHVDTDRYWLPHPDSLFLSWAFGFCILGGIFCLVSAMCLTTDFIRLRIEDAPYDDPRRSEARYAAPPPRYDVAVIAYDRPTKTVPPPPPSSHQNDGYSPPQPDPRQEGRKSLNNRSSGTAAPLIRQTDRYSEPESEPDDAYDGHPNRGRSSRQKGRHSESQHGDEEMKSYDRQSKAGQPPHRDRRDPDPLPGYDEDEDTKPHEKRSDPECQSRRISRRAESEPRSHHNEDAKSRDRSTERPSKHSTRRSEPHSQYDDETRSVDRQSNTSRPSRQNPRHSEGRSHDDEARSRSRRGDTTPPPSRNARRSGSQSRQEESKLYDRRASAGRSGRQTSRRSESQPRYEDSRPRY